MTRSMRWGLVGASTIASQFMVDALRRPAGASVVSVVSSDVGRGRDFAARHEIGDATVDLGELLARDDIDAVYISTTNDLHADQAIAAARAGKHVLCEKPLATTLEGARAMLQAARDNDVVLATNHHLRGAAIIRAIRQHIRAGAVGTCLYVDIEQVFELPEDLRGWRLARADGGGVAFDLLCHAADVLRFLLDDEIAEVTALADGSSPVEQGLFAVLGLQGGVVAQSANTFNVPHGGSRLTVHGSDGSLEAFDVMTQHPQGRLVLRDSSGVHEIPIEQRPVYDMTVERFMSAVAGAGTALASGEDGVRSLQVTLAARRSVEERRTISLR